MNTVRRLQFNGSEVRLLNFRAKSRIKDSEEDDDEDEDNEDMEEEDRSSKVSDNDDDNDEMDDPSDNPDLDEDDDTEDEKRSVEGYAAVFNSDSEDLGGFIERVAPTAFKRSLDDAANGKANIYMLWSHNVALPRGSTKSKTLELSTDKTGLRFKLDATRLSREELMAVEAGELQMSFGFSVRDDSWEQTPTGDYIRTLNDVELFEVSLVTQPAYSATEAGLRNISGADEAKRSFEAFMSSRAENNNKYIPNNRVELKLRAAELMSKLISKR